MRTRIQATEAYELSVDITPTTYGHHLQLISFVPTARNPRNHIPFRALLSVSDLTSLRDSIDRALAPQLHLAHPVSP